MSSSTDVAMARAILVVTSHHKQEVIVHNAWVLI